MLRNNLLKMFVLIAGASSKYDTEPKRLSLLISSHLQYALSRLFESMKTFEMLCNCKNYIRLTLKENRDIMLKSLLVKYNYIRVLHSVLQSVTPSSCVGIVKVLKYHSDIYNNLQQTSFWLVHTLQKNTVTVRVSL